MTVSIPLPEGYSLEGRNALVTGGGTHLGFAMAQALAAQEARVTVLGRTEAFLKAAAERLGPTHRYVVADLIREETYARLLADGTHFDILVNNAGGDPYDAAWEEQSTEHWLYTYQLNVIAPNRLAQSFVPGMKERGWGRIINIASVYGMVAPKPENRPPGKDCGAYTAAKHAVIGLTHFLAAKLGRSGITVNAVSPGMFPLPADDPYMGKIPGRKPLDPARRAFIDAQAPLNRCGVPVDLGGAVAFLASPAAAFITGQNLAVDGGWTVW
ncbi:MAG: SDR family oxidoreductase [Alphaproteobacteria bacterium]|nr:SDR family oxidoreductase [Alphaproteobacteria bacterium]